MYCFVISHANSGKVYCHGLIVATYLVPFKALTFSSVPASCRVIFVWVGTLYRVAQGGSASRFMYRYFQYSSVTHNFISNSRITNFNYNKRVEYLAFQHFYLKYFLFAFNKDLNLPHIGKSYCDKAFLEGNVTERRQMNWSWIHSITCDCHYRVGTHKIFPC